MEHSRTAVIIGAGTGGIATAIFLSQKGFKVTVYEKNLFPGGRCGRITRDGHRFDTGATILLMPSIYRMVFSGMGLDFDSEIKKRKIDNLYRIFFRDKRLDFTPDKEYLKSQLEKIEPGSYANSQKYVSTGYGFFKMAVEKLLARNFITLRDFSTMGNFVLLLRLKAYLRHSFYIKRFFKDPDLRKAFTFQNIYVGQNPLTAPALFTMIPASELTEGGFFPEGGMYAVTEKLMSVAQSLGAEFIFGTPVKRIITEDNTVKGIETEDGKVVEASVVIANADLPYVYSELLPGGGARIKKLRYGCSAIVLHWGLDRRYDGFSHHNVFLSENYEDNLKKIFHDNSLSPLPSFYVHAPVRTDPSSAPEGHDTLSVIIPCGHVSPRDSNNWTALKEIAVKSVIQRLEKEGFQDIGSHIKFEICYLPPTWISTLNLSRGATFGSLAHNIFQMGYFRPHNRHRKYRNLYFAGGSTHPGNGVPLVLLSAKLTSERILNEL